MILAGDALDLIQQEEGTFSLIATDPPYVFGGSGAIVDAAAAGGMNAIGYEKNPPAPEKQALLRTGGE